MPICGLHARRQRDLREPLENPLAVPGIFLFIVEDQLEVGEAEKRKRTQMHDVGNAVHHDFERNGDLLLDLFGGNSRPLRDDLHVVIRHVRIGFDGKLVEGNRAPAKQQNGPGQNQRSGCSRAKSTRSRIIAYPGFCRRRPSAIDQHGRLSFTHCPRCFAGPAASPPPDAPAQIRVISCMLFGSVSPAVTSMRRNFLPPAGT